MKTPAEETAAVNKDPAGGLQGLRHDINNQLSNILLAVEQLKYEIPNPSEDCTFYLNSIAISAEKINSLLTEY